MNKQIQKQLLLEEFKKGNVREDHYNGKNSLTRLAIDIKIDSEEQKNSYINLFNNLDMRPEFLIFDETEKCMHLWWFSQQNNVLTNKKQYLRLLDEFIDYIDALGLCNWEVNTGMLGDDPILLFLDSRENEEIIINPSFNKKNFSLNGKMQIHLNSCKWQVLSVKFRKITSLNNSQLIITNFTAIVYVPIYSSCQ